MEGIRLSLTQQSTGLLLPASTPCGRVKPELVSNHLHCTKKLPKRPWFCYNRGNGGVFMEDWRKDARHEPIIVDLEALVPKEHLL